MYKRLALSLSDEFAGQLDALGFAAGERRRSLAELQVIEANVVQGLEHPGDLGDVREVLQSLLDVHLEDVG